MTTPNTAQDAGGGGDFKKDSAANPALRHQAVVVAAHPGSLDDEKYPREQPQATGEPKQEIDSSIRSGISVESTPKRTWRSHLWDTFDRSPEERRFLFKLDAVILTFASLGYFIKYLDQVNISNAYVSGMKEDLGLHGNEFNIMTTAWTVGYVIGEVPR